MSSSSNNRNVNNSSGAAANPNTDLSSSGKKRKVWARSGQTVSFTDSSIRTENFKGMNNNQNNGIDPEQLEASIMGMNPADAAKYRELHKAHIQRMGSVDSGRGGQGGTEVKISFGPSRPPTTSSNNGKVNMNSSPPAGAANMAAVMGVSSAMNGGIPLGAHVAGSSSINFSDLDLEALKEKAAAAAAGQNTFRNKHGLPCTEAEMKALMSMFVEIMGMSMSNNKGENDPGAMGGDTTINPNENRKNFNPNFSASVSSSSSSSKSGPIFSFGSNPMDASSLAAMAAAASGTSPGMIPDHMAAATAGFFADGASWEALRRTYAAAEQMVTTEDDDDEDDDESFENRELTFEEVEFLLHHRKQKEEAVKLASQFASGDWESIEQVAINDHILEADDRERKAAKKRQKKQRRKAKLKEEAAQKAAEAAQKKREKAIVSWRSRVVSACQSNEITKLDGLLQESPLRKLAEEDNDEVGNVSTSSIITHLEFLLPNSVAKNRAHVERGIEARLRLAEYVLQTELLLAFKPLRSGRTAFHTACFHGDVRFLQLLFDKVDSYEPNDGKDPLPESFLNLTCDESGWSPLHYAVVSGSSEAMELLLEKGSSLSTLTDITHTWRESDGTGITPRELVQYVQSADYEKIIETHGLALQEMTNAFFNHHQERRVFLRKLEHVLHRLSDVEKNGYVPITKDSTKLMTDPVTSNNEATSIRSENSLLRLKKKKKKKKKQTGKEVESKPPGSDTANQKHQAETNSVIDVKKEKDPLVTALLGMGFNESQILAAVEACGGTYRATADDLVTWILGQGDEEVSAPGSDLNVAEKDQQAIEEENRRKKELSESDEIARKEESARQQEETILRLAAKREEARRRNREWNNREQARQEQEAKAKVAQKIFAVSRPSVPTSHLGADMPLQNKAFSRGLHGIHPTGSTLNYPMSGVKPSNRQSQMVSNTPDISSVGQWASAPIPKQSHPFTGNPTQPKTVAPHTNYSGPVQISNQSVSSFFSGINDDEKTVSSFGSNRGFSVSSKEFVPANFTATPSASLASSSSIPPPGFMGPSQQMTAHLRPPVATVPEDSSAVAFSDGNQQGEIRATAKAFVPSSFVQNTRPERSAPQAGLSSGLFQHNGASTGHSSAVGSSVPNSFDLTPSITPASEDSAAPGNFFVNAPNEEEPPLPAPFGFPRSKSEDPSHIDGSKLLNSISRITSSGSAGTSIWGGDSQNIPSLESTLHPSFFDQTNASDEKSSSWYIPDGNLPSANGKGSIW